MLPKLILAILLLSSCSLIWPAHLVVDVPPRPALATCPQLPQITAKVQDGTVLLSLEQAQALKTWIHDYQTCAESNQAVLVGHIEKLENRLKALNH